MNKIFPFLAILILGGCDLRSDQERINDLGGYWAIQKAVLPGGFTKEYNSSQVVDFIEIQEQSGSRKKVRPQLNGKFLYSGGEETFDIKWEEDSLNLYYSTPYDSRKETVISVDEDELVILGEGGIKFYYETYTPISIDYGEEKE